MAPTTGGTRIRPNAREGRHGPESQPVPGRRRSGGLELFRTRSGRQRAGVVAVSERTVAYDSEDAYGCHGRFLFEIGVEAFSACGDETDDPFTRDGECVGCPLSRPGPCLLRRFHSPSVLGIRQI